MRRSAVMMGAVTVMLGCGGHTVSLGSPDGSSAQSSGGGSSQGGAPSGSLENAGTCGDAGGRVVVLATGLNPNGGLAVSATTVFVASGSVVKAVPKCGGSAVDLVSDSLFFVPRVQVGPSNVFWGGQFGIESGGLSEAPFGGGPVKTVASTGVSTFAVEPTEVVVGNAGHCYSGSECNGSICCSGTLTSVPPTGGTARTITKNVSPTLLVADADNVYWTGTLGTKVNGGTPLFSVPLAGGTSTEIAPDNSYPALALDDAFVYWPLETDPIAGSGSGVGGGKGGSHGGGQASGSGYVAPANGQIMRVAKTGGTPTAIVSKISPGTSLVIDSGFVYWTEPGEGCPLGGCKGTVRKASLADGEPITLADGLDTPTAVAVDATSVYWLTSDKLMKLTPK